MVQLITGFDLLVHPIAQSFTWQTGIRDIYQDACQVKDLLVSLASTLGGKLDSFDHGAVWAQLWWWWKAGLITSSPSQTLILMWCREKSLHSSLLAFRPTGQPGSPRMALMGSSYDRRLCNEWPAYDFYWTFWKLEQTIRLSRLYKYMMALKWFYSWLGLNVLFFSCPTDVCDFKRGCFWTEHRVWAQFITVWTF